MAVPLEVRVGLEGPVEGARDAERFTCELKKIEKNTAVTEKQLSSPTFVDRAPADVVKTGSGAWPGD